MRGKATSIVAILAACMNCVAAGPFLPFKANAIFSTPLSCYPGQATIFSQGVDGVLPTAATLNASRYGYANLAGWVVGVSGGLEYKTAALQAWTVATNFCGTVGTINGSSVMGVRSYQQALGTFCTPFAATLTNAPTKASIGCWITVGYPDNHVGTHDILTIYGAVGGEFCNLDLIGDGTRNRIVLEKGGPMTPNSNMTNGVRYWVTQQYDSTDGASAKHSMKYYNTSVQLLGSATVSTNTVTPMPLPGYVTLGIQNHQAADPTSYIDYAGFVYDPTGRFPLLPNFQ